MLVWQNIPSHWIQRNMSDRIIPAKMITLELWNIETSLVLNSKRNVWSVTVHAVKRPDQPLIFGAADIIEIPFTLGKRLVIKNAVYNVVDQYEANDMHIAVLEISGQDIDMLELVMTP